MTEIAMFMKQYIHRLPADYDMGRIENRAAERGPLWDETPGLGFKAFIAQRQGRNGATGNTYSSLYLWLDDEAATDFITSDRFQAVIDGFGRPHIETWLPFDIHLGNAGTALSADREDIAIEARTDFAALKKAEAERNGGLARQADTFAAVTAIDLSTWRLTRFRLSAEAAGTPRAGSAYDILHLSKPGIPSLFAAA
jgi:heme-degrading monooxygenase HmoA